MKNNYSLYLIFLLFITIGCTKKKETLTINQKEINNKVSSALDNWHKAATNANFDNYFNTMDSISVFVGTDAGEVWTKKQFKAFSKPYFDKGKAWDFTAINRNIYIDESGKIVWFDELLNTWMGICRGSGVLKKINNQWKIKHYVLSVTVPNDDINKVIKAKQRNDSLFISNKKPLVN
ncbi:nuclear transport factor 2 family protein [Tenacibaculum geojense]|uniref:Nuclear transport factor 2 family protein n=1 Tax=Tenacibaculum geojense TaxID=915352 RepID=A0ABW3JPV6_9FLAO